MLWKWKRILAYIPIALGVFAISLSFGIAPLAASADLHGPAPVKIGGIMRVAAYCEKAEFTKNWPRIVDAIRTQNAQEFQNIMLRKGVNCIELRYGGYPIKFVVARVTRHLESYQRTSGSMTCFRLIELKIRAPQLYAGKTIRTWVNVKCARGQAA